MKESAPTQETKKMTANQMHDLMYVADSDEGRVEGAKDRALNALRDRGLLARRTLPAKGRHGKAVWTITDDGRTVIADLTECKAVGCASRHTFGYRVAS